MKNSLYEAFVNFLWISSKNPIGRLVWRFLYFLNYFGAKLFILTFTSPKHLFLKGSYARKDYMPLVSDIDFVVVFDAGHLETGSKRVEFAKFLFPLVKDADCFETEYFYSRVRYGSKKYLSFNEWRKLDSNPIGKLKRFGYPLKNDFDALHEVYFYVEWIHFNLNHDRPNSYRIACAKRSCRRLIEFLPITNLEIEKGLAETKTKEDILFWLFETLESTLVHSPLVEKFGLIHFDLNEVASRDYFRENFELVPEGKKPGFGESKIYLGESSFKTLFGLGVLDSTVVYDFLAKGDDPFLNSLFDVEYFQAIQEGRHNSLHDSVENVQLQKRFSNAQKFLSNYEVFNGHKSFGGKIVYVTAGWDKSYLTCLERSHREMLKTSGGEIEFLHISLGGNETYFESLSSLMTLRIEPGEENAGLWHRESLHNIALTVCHGADLVIFGDMNAYINEQGWTEKLISAINGRQAVQIPYGEMGASFWAFSKEGVKKLGRFFDYFHEGSNSQVVLKQVTGQAIGLLDELAWTKKAIEDHIQGHIFDCKTLECGTSLAQPQAPAQPVNRMALLNLIYPYLTTQLERGELGLWRWRKKADASLRVIVERLAREQGILDFAFVSELGEIQSHILSSKNQESIFYLGSGQDTWTQSKPGELALLADKNSNLPSFHVFSERDSFLGEIVSCLREFKKGSTYCFNFVFASPNDLTEGIRASLGDCSSDDVIFRPRPIAENFWALTIGLYAFEDFASPKLKVNIETNTPIKIETKKLTFDEFGANGDKELEYRGENKGHTESPTQKINLPIARKFTPDWHKIVVKLEGEVESFKVRILDAGGELLTSPRIQERGGDYLTIYFRPAMVMKLINVELELGQASNFGYEAVCFLCEKGD